MTDLPIEHQEIGAWAEDIKGHSDQVCGVQCACGETFDGFATLAEAREQLDAHIEDERVKADVPSADNLRQHVLRRRRTLGLSQQDVQARRGPSVATLRTIENGRFTDLRTSTKRDLDAALEWPEGTADKLLRGVAAPGVTEPEVKEDFAVERVPSDFGQMIQAARNVERLSIRQAAKLAGISEGRWRQLEAGQRSVGNGETLPVSTKPETAVAMADAVLLDRASALQAAGLSPAWAVRIPEGAAPKAAEYRSDPVLVRAADAAPRALGEYIGHAVALVLLNHEHDEHPDLDIHGLAHCVLVLASIGGGGGS